MNWENYFAESPGEKKNSVRNKCGNGCCKKKRAPVFERDDEPVSKELRINTCRKFFSACTEKSNAAQYSTGRRNNTKTALNTYEGHYGGRRFDPLQIEGKRLAVSSQIGCSLSL
jgi:hypothetical protein